MDGSRQFLTFALGSEQYGIDILQVQEIRGWTAVTKMPEGAPYVLGVLNLRGSIVPIVDLRVRFDLPCADFTPLTVIIVLALKSGGPQCEFGLVVDAVSDVIDIEPGQMKEAPRFGATAAVQFVQALAVVGHRMLILLNAESLIRRGIEFADLPALHSVA